MGSILSGLANLLGMGGGTQTASTNSTVDPNQPQTTTVTLSPEAAAAQAEAHRNNGANLATPTASPTVAQAPKTLPEHETSVALATQVFETAKATYIKAAEVAMGRVEAELKTQEAAVKAAAESLQNAIKALEAFKAAQTQPATTIQPAAAQAIAPQAAHQVAAQQQQATPGTTTTMAGPANPSTMTFNPGAAGTSGANTQTTTAPQMGQDEALALLQQAMMAAQQQQAPVPATK